MLLNPIPHPENLSKDSRFSALVGPENWLKLPAAIRHRFGRRIKGGDSVAYQGCVTSMQMNWAGWALAQAARLIGAPLPYDLGCIDKPAVVIVTEDVAGRGQFWIRQYGLKSGFPQVVHSSKRFAGPTGLEEHIGFGIGMALRVEANAQELLFKSDHYFLSLLGHRIRLPRVLSPALVVGHHELGHGQFRFSLRVGSKLLGRMLSQDAVFGDAPV